MNAFFQEVSRVNAAHCASLGLSAIAERYRTGFGGDTVDMNLARLRIGRDCRLRRAKYRNYYPDTPFERLARIERRIKGA